MKKSTTEIGLPRTASKTMSRRSLLDWLGKATVLALGGEALAACGIEGLGALDGSVSDVGNHQHVDAGADVSIDAFGDGDILDHTDPWAFRPPESYPDIYTGWPVRTVDHQELEAILQSWQLRVEGLVENPFSLTFAELVEVYRQDQVTDFHCVEGWSVFDVPWNGVHLSSLLDMAGPLEAATYITFHTIDSRYNESLPLEVALEPTTLLAYGVDNHTLPMDHGFPVRLVVPRLYAYKSAKYVDRIELTDRPLEGYWVGRGYPYLGEVPESRLRPGRY